MSPPRYHAALKRHGSKTQNWYQQLHYWRRETDKLLTRTSYVFSLIGEDPEVYPHHFLLRLSHRIKRRGDQGMDLLHDSERLDLALKAMYGIWERTERLRAASAALMHVAEAVGGKLFQYEHFPLYEGTGEQWASLETELKDRRDQVSSNDSTSISEELENQASTTV